MSSLTINTLGRNEVLVDNIPAEWHAQAAQELFFYCPNSLVKTMHFSARL
jgi:hypothetical protein